MITQTKSKCSVCKKQFVSRYICRDLNGKVYCNNCLSDKIPDTITNKDAEKIFGKDIWNKMGKYMGAITITMNDKGEGIPFRDVWNAWRELNGDRIHPEEWD